MAKVKTAWFCTECGNESPKWMGQCPACGAWNTMKEEVISGKTSASDTRRGLLKTEKAKPVSLKEITTSDEDRISLNSREVDRLLGGGLVSGSVTLIGGEPGIGKSTLSLQLPLNTASLKVLYVSGEESKRQIKLRANRLGGNDENCYILCETSVDSIISEATKFSPDLLIVDSIQTVYTESVESSPGSVAQVRESAATLLRYAKESGVPVILIGHITKEGSIAGPKVLEHIVDVVLQFEGDTKHSYRILRSIKNRFGSTDEIAVFEMTGSGLREVTNPSEMLIPMHEENLSGIAVAAMTDGTRPMLIETQALVSTAAYGTPQRSATGFDVKSMNMLLAVLEKRAGFKLSVKDVFFNIAGGLKVTDTATDLSVVVSVLSSNFDTPVSSKYCFAGEVGLSGEIRPVSRTEQRINEAEKLGFEKIFISSFGTDGIGPHHDIQIVTVASIPELCRKLWGQQSA